MSDQFESNANDNNYIVPVYTVEAVISNKTELGARREMVIEQYFLITFLKTS